MPAVRVRKRIQTDNMGEGDDDKVRVKHSRPKWKRAGLRQYYVQRFTPLTCLDWVYRLEISNSVLNWCSVPDIVFNSIIS